MTLGFDLLYIGGAFLTAPLWLWRMARTGKLRTDWAARFGRTRPLPVQARPRLLLHAVSVGEVNAIRQLVDELEGKPDGPEVVVAVTTDTGFLRARALWPERNVVRYPFDFSWAVRRFLEAVKPDAVALVELEVWPNFTQLCQRRGVPVAVINGRLTARSAARYRRVRWLISPSFRRLARIGVQNAKFGARFVELGALPDRVSITGTMKWDTAQIADEVTGAEQLAEEMGIDRNRPLVVAGSTAPGEPELLVKCLPGGAQLLCAPRRPEWFDQAAEVLSGCARRTAIRRGHQRPGSAAGRFLLDTIGELRQAYALADVVVVGRSFGTLHGSDMMEPIALGKPTVVGPAVDDFSDAMAALLAGGGVVQTSADQLGTVLADLLMNHERRQLLVRNGREVIRANQGATIRNAQLIRTLLKDSGKKPTPGYETQASAEEKEERP